MPSADFTTKQDAAETGSANSRDCKWEVFVSKDLFRVRFATDLLSCCMLTTRLPCATCGVDIVCPSSCAHNNNEVISRKLTQMTGMVNDRDGLKAPPGSI